MPIICATSSRDTFFLFLLFSLLFIYSLAFVFSSSSIFQYFCFCTSLLHSSSFGYRIRCIAVSFSFILSNCCCHFSFNSHSIAAIHIAVVFWWIERTVRRLLAWFIESKNAKGNTEIYVSTLVVWLVIFTVCPCFEIWIWPKSLLMSINAHLRTSSLLNSYTDFWPTEFDGSKAIYFFFFCWLPAECGLSL